MSKKVGKIRFSGTGKSVLLKASSGERCVPCDVKRYTCSSQRIPRCVLNEIDYGKINVETGIAVSTRMTSLTWRH